MKSSNEQVLSRRKALAGAGAAGAAAAVVAVASSGVAPAPEQSAAADTAREGDSAEGYRLTEHIKRYYSTART